ncbi:Interferon-induced GTP-binding protein MxE [Colletotrichum aenigma]|uniref:Interferon-induced GTP-binding protein MxE n=1 Tax=Colletotrichum aenigma TaxID=1215731 RepID=UPI0018730374|nr:Interferon-induced GTP-binding protein MxE [Colletotrichum aenigma]KAF5502514.1 Interferon-induced GTP-binding protein MxE [Colletotrichum aenigma]
MANNILDLAAPNELNSTETKLVFDTVDKLLPLGLSKIADLPQIIVVGDRSSGKSSVFETIANVRLPGTVAKGRFATEFADNTKSPHSLKLTTFNRKEIDEFIGEIGKQIGLPELGRNLSLDVLRLEIERPKLIPINDEASMMNLVAGYMEKPSRIILAVISAENELESQSIVQEAAKYDPSGQRTLGVITKPDLIHPGSPEENEYLKIARSREAARNLGLGWHVLCNRKDDEDLDPREFVEFQKLARDGIWGHYDDPLFGGFNGTHRKLRSQLRDLNRALRHILLTLGSAQLVMGRPNAGPLQYATPAYLEELLQTYTDEVTCPQIVAWADLSSELETQSAASQGTHLPPFVNMDIVMPLFQKQSAPWKRIVEIHIEKLIYTLKAFVDEALEEIIGSHGSSNTTNTILSTCVDTFFDKKEDLL